MTTRNLIFAAILSAVSIPLLAKQKENSNMKFQTTKVDGFNIVGFKTRTSG